ncbi:hypothetical protein predicted by Glimmer/Critica [Sorangium cellulosum So ce56]|uniref:Uncharacterized protein n=1 Tax=Sorangium cellulosum (strain So ce56) TaxID=448385 RepID=A9GA95_SORC5|nr:hypothetical protein predicted by Glimmer/Critica [Sorangium cellulosum So ce56]
MGARNAAIKPTNPTTSLGCAVSPTPRWLRCTVSRRWSRGEAQIEERRVEWPRCWSPGASTTFARTPREATSPAATGCTLPSTGAAEKLTAVTTFVGSDEYPARVTCEYDTTVHFPCGVKELRH